MSQGATQPWDTDRVAETIESYWRANLHEQFHRDALVDLVQHCLPDAYATLLEVGCGSALIYERLVRTPLLRARYVGIDSSVKMLAIAKRNAPDGSFLAADGYAIPVRDHAIDVTVCFEVLGHLREIDAFLSELCRVTRRTLLFTIWPSEAGDVVDGHEEIDGVMFPHRAYSDAYIRRLLGGPHGLAPTSIDLYVLSAECWAYAVHWGGDDQRPTSSLVPFRSYQQRYTKQLDAEIHDRDRRLSETDERLQRAEHRGAVLDHELEQQRTLLAKTDEELADTRRHLFGAQAEAETARRRLEVAEQQLEELASTRQGLEHAGEQLRQALEQIRALDLRAGATERQLSIWQHAARTAAADLAVMRRRRLFRFVSRFRAGNDLSAQISPAFQDLLDDSYLFLGNLNGFRLQPGDDLRAPRFPSYTLRLGRPNLSGLLLAPILDIPDQTGSFGIELASPGGPTLARASVALSEVDQHRPARFEFPPIAASDGPLVLELVVRDATSPVRLFEWRRRRYLGLLARETRPFCGFLFA